MRGSRWSRAVIPAILSLALNFVPTVGQVVAMTAGTASPSIFTATMRNQTPVGNPPGGAHAATNRSNAHRELPDFRSQNAKVYQNGKTLQQVVSLTPIHYLDTQGRWQDIDNTLVPSHRLGYAASNKANSWTMDLPRSLVEPVWISSPAGTLGMRPAAATAVGATVGALRKYEGAWPGVTLDYQATSSGVKESIILDSLSASATRLTFVLSLSQGETVQQLPSGEIHIADLKGNVAFVIPPAYMRDASFGKPGATDPLSWKVRMSVRHDQSATYLDVVPDTSWLSSPGRMWPVTIDPSTYSGQPSSNCILITTPGISTCSDDILQVGFYNNTVSRVLLMFSPWTNRVGTVLNATLNMSLTYPAATPQSIEMHALTRSWTNQATWATYDGSHAWTTAGGDYNAVSEWTTTGFTTANAWYQWYPTNLTQSWFNAAPEYGVLLKATNESSSGTAVTFASTFNANTSARPYMTFTFAPSMGDLPQYQQDRSTLTGQLSMATNIGNGNELLKLHLFNVRGVGLNLDADAYFNEFQSLTMWDMGKGWNLPFGYDVWLDTFSFNDGAIFYSPTGALYRFAINGSSYISPPGINATLSSAGGGSHTLTFHPSEQTLTFSSGGYFISKVDRNGNTISFLYDANGALSSVRDTENRITNFSYSPTGNCGATVSGVITRITDSAGRQYDFGYNFATCNLTTYTDPQNGPAAPLRFAYAADGSLDHITDNKGNTPARFTYQTPTIHAGWIATVGRVYDSLGNAYTTSYSDGVDPTRPSPAGVNTVTDSNGHQTLYTFDTNGLVTQVADALGHTHSSTYDSNYDPLQVTDALGQTTTITYDANFNVIRMQHPPSRLGQIAGAVTFSYQTAGKPYLVSSRTDTIGGCGAYSYDPSGNLVGVYSGQTSPCDGHTGGALNCDAYQGNPVGTCGATSTVSCLGAKGGEICWAQDANGHRTAYAYDSNGNLTSVTPPAPLGQTQMTVDNLSRTTSITDGKGQKTTFLYDNLDRLVQILYNGSTTCSSSLTCTTFQWDTNGNLVRRTDATGTTTFSFDRLNRPITKALPDATANCNGQTGIAMTYDGVGNLIQYCDSGGIVSYGYDSANRITSLAEPTGSCSGTISLCTTYNYDNANRLVKLTFPGGGSQNISYDNVGNKTTVTGTDSASRVISSFNYAYSVGTQDLNTRVSMTQNDPVASLTTTYTYDPFGRLTQASNAQSTLTYGYDLAGNRTSAAGGAATFNNANEIMSSPGYSSYSFDLDGNLTAAGSSGNTASYNSQNQTTAVTWLGQTVNLTYAGIGQTERASSGPTSFASSSQGLAISKTSGASTYFLRDSAGRLLGERASDGSHWYYLKDAIGSIVAVVSGAGTSVANRYAYDPYGKVTFSSVTVNNPWGYAGGYTDSTTLVKLGARYYDPNLGRFTQPDPAALTPVYKYAADNPVNLSDPTGNYLVCECGDPPPPAGYTSPPPPSSAPAAPQPSKACCDIPAAGKALVLSTASGLVESVPRVSSGSSSEPAWLRVFDGLSMIGYGASAFLAGPLLIAISIPLAPETFGLSVVVAIPAGVGMSLGGVLLVSTGVQVLAG